MSLRNIQTLVGTTPDGQFGPMTACAIAAHFKLDRSQAAHILGQCCVESGDWQRFEENLNYSAKRIMEVFGRRFQGYNDAKQYEFMPRALASFVYSNRMGNGDEASGDGWKHRGFGAIQLTGKNNHYAFADHVGDPAIKADPSLIATRYAIESAIWFFQVNRIDRIARRSDEEAILQVSKAVNLGNPNSPRMPLHYRERLAWTRRIFAWLSEAPRA